MAIVLGPLFVDCKRCGSRIKLSSKSQYDTLHWRTHRTRCLKRQHGLSKKQRSKSTVRKCVAHILYVPPPLTTLPRYSHPLPRPRQRNHLRPDSRGLAHLFPYPRTTRPLLTRNLGTIPLIIPRPDTPFPRRLALLAFAPQTPSSRNTSSVPITRNFDTTLPESQHTGKTGAGISSYCPNSSATPILTNPNYLLATTQVNRVPMRLCQFLLSLDQLDPPTLVFPHVLSVVATILLSPRYSVVL
jgi:hypothetical protein